MSIEAMKLALRRAFNLGQTYWQQADSEYSSHWKKADVTKASFDQLVEETCQAIEQAQKQEQKVDWEKLYRLEVKKKEALAAKYERDIKPLTRIVPMAQKPEGYQEPVAWMFQHEETRRMNYVSNDGMNTPELFLKMNRRYVFVCALYTSPPQRQPLTDEQARAIIGNVANIGDGLRVARAIEAAHGIKGEA